MFFINLVTLRAFVLRPEEVQFNMANIGMPSFPYSFQAFEMANTHESMVGIIAEMEISLWAFYPSAFHTVFNV